MAVPNRAMFQRLTLTNLSNWKIPRASRHWLTLFDDVEEYMGRMPHASGAPGTWASALHPAVPARMEVDQEAARLECVVREIAQSTEARRLETGGSRRFTVLVGH